VSRIHKTSLFASICGGVLGGCAIVPDLPPDWAMPQREILHHAACELQAAFRYLDTYPPPKNVFVARDWTIRVTLNPKLEDDIVPGAGLTRKQPTKTGVLRSANWVLGGSNGLTADMRGDSNGSLDFVFDSAKLIDDNSLDCEHEPFPLHSLSKSIGIENWLIHSVDAAVVTNSSLDKPSFGKEVYTRWSGAGSYTYTFPPGTDLLTLSSYYQLDQVLNINIAAKAISTPLKATTLPAGGLGFGPNAPTGLVKSTVQILQDQRSDLQQIQQAISNLRVNTQ
jgi:hypothetical protein